MSVDAATSSAPRYCNLQATPSETSLVASLIRHSGQALFLIFDGHAGRAFLRNLLAPYRLKSLHACMGIRDWR